MFTKPVWDYLSFVTWCIILLEVAIRRWVHSVTCLGTTQPFQFFSGQMGVRIANDLNDWLILAHSEAELVSHRSFLQPLMALFHCMVRHGTVRYGSLLGGFPLGTVPGTWYFFSTTSVEVPSEPYRYQNMTCKLCWSLIGRRKSSLLRHWTCDTRPSSTALPARFKSAQPAKDRTQLLFKQTHIFASATK